MITLQEAIKKSPILLSQYWKMSDFHKIGKVLIFLPPYIHLHYLFHVQVTINRFDLGNAINDYQRIKICVVSVC